MSKSYGQLIPSVERRLSTWVGITEQRAPSVAPGSRPMHVAARNVMSAARPSRQPPKQFPSGMATRSLI